MEYAKNRQRNVGPQNYLIFFLIPNLCNKVTFSSKKVLNIIFLSFKNYLLKITTLLSYKIMQKLKRIGLLILGS